MTTDRGALLCGLVADGGMATVERVRWHFRQQRTSVAYHRALTRYHRQRRRARARTVVGLAAALVLILVAISGELLPSALLAVLAATIGILGWRRSAVLAEPDPADHPALTVPYDSPAGRAIRRLDAASAVMRRMLPAVRSIDRTTGDELAAATRSADRDLRVVAERFGLAVAAGASGDALSSLLDRLEGGVAAYERTLAAAAELLAAPDVEALGDALHDARDALAARTYGVRLVAERLGPVG